MSEQYQKGLKSDDKQKQPQSMKGLHFSMRSRIHYENYSAAPYKESVSSCLMHISYTIVRYLNYIINNIQTDVSRP